MQAFEWYVAADGKHLRRLARDIPLYEEIGITALWIPPGCKAIGPEDNGYGVYGSIRPKVPANDQICGISENSIRKTRGGQNGGHSRN